MPDFQLDTAALEDHVRRARQTPPSDAVDAVCERARLGAGLDPMELAGLWFAPLDSETLYQRVRALRGARALHLETFSPLYMSNTCDAECRMCGMRRDNQALTRETADLAAVHAQLRVLSERGMRAVALLTGEYAPANRPWAMRYVNQALRYTQELGFKHVLLNVGSIDTPEFDTLLAGIPRHADGSLVPFLTMSTFQETYAPETYAKFMGTNRDNPRADFQRRLTNFDRAYRAGMRVANPGILVGLNRDVAYEMTSFALHVQHLQALGMQVYVSVPRLRKVAGSGNQRGLGDEDFVRLVSLLSLALPDAKIVITTRENPAMQQKLLPIVSVISAGSAAVAPYTDSGARFPLDTSQFEVIDQRPFEEILRTHLAPGVVIDNFQPPTA